MTYFQRTDLPADIDSVEKLQVWATSVLAYLYPNQMSFESKEVGVRQASLLPFYNDSEEDSGLWHWQVISRCSLWQSAGRLTGGQEYQYVQPLGQLIVPDQFKGV